MAEVARYRFEVPEHWELHPLPSDGSLHAVIATPERGATVQLEVLSGLGSPEVLQRYLDMHRALAPQPPAAERSKRPDLAELSLELGAAEPAVHRRVHAALVAEDLLSVVLTWSGAVDDGALQRASLRAIESVLPESGLSDSVLPEPVLPEPVLPESGLAEPGPAESGPELQRQEG